MKYNPKHIAERWPFAGNSIDNLLLAFACFVGVVVVGSGVIDFPPALVVWVKSSGIKTLGSVLVATVIAPAIITLFVSGVQPWATAKGDFIRWLHTSFFEFDGRAKIAVAQALKKYRLAFQTSRVSHGWLMTARQGYQRKLQRASMFGFVAVTVTSLLGWVCGMSAWYCFCILGIFVTRGMSGAMADEVGESFRDIEKMLLDPEIDRVLKGEDE